MLEFFIKGGITMYPILIGSLLSVTIFFERMFYLKSVKTKSKKFIIRLNNLVKKGSIESAISFCRKNSIPISKIMLSGLLKYGQRREEIKEAIEDSANLESPELEKNLSVLATVGNVAPLFGLLGTVFGMIRAFNVIATIGVGQAQPLAGGISEALLTTAFGLSVAIPTVIFFNYLSARVDILIRDMEASCLDLLDLLTNQGINHSEVVQDTINLGGDVEYEVSSSEKK
jgi:biopolymer transport protein ExbB